MDKSILWAMATIALLPPRLADIFLYLAYKKQSVFLMADLAHSTRVDFMNLLPLRIFVLIFLYLSPAFFVCQLIDLFHSRIKLFSNLKQTP